MSIQITKSDALSFLKTLEDNSIDCALYDPPYFMGKKPFVNEKKKYTRLVEDWDNQWNNLEEYLAWCEQWIIETKRVLKPGGSFLVFGSHHCAFDTHVLMRKHLDFRNFIPWFITNAPPIFMAKQSGVYAYSCQYINYFSKGRVAFFDYDYLKSENDDKQQRDFIIIYPNKPTSERVGHPSQKPLKLIERLVKAHCPEDGIVLDIFAGSGTAALACKNTNRSNISCEISDEYYDMILKRLQ